MVRIFDHPFVKLFFQQLGKRTEFSQVCQRPLLAIKGKRLGNENRLTRKISLLGMNKIRKSPAELDSAIVLSEEFLAVDDDNVRTAPIMADKDIWSLLKTQKVSLM
ncbi:hypothetical protein TNCV_1321511 [Trichonephila clavipes]|nr:hypothetical protein TNCV_1321511 [Trichonephila clavipes]